MEEVPANYLMPSFGYCYEGSLKDVDLMSASGWFEVRVTLTDADGNSQTQTIYPAFYVKECVGIETVGIESDEMPAVYYNTLGQRVSGPQAGQILIKRQGAKSTKMIF